MIPEDVTLIVKAPNQQIEDQNVDCKSSWTVMQLKGHLSQIYPSKPKTDEQKIIYSGQLLDDKAVLKDVLRTYENVSKHTMHLVCTPKRRFMEPKRSESVPPSSSDGLRRRPIIQPETPPAATNTTPIMSARPLENTNVNRPETRQNDHNREIEMQNYLSSVAASNYGRVPPYPTNYNMGLPNPVAGDPASVANHVLMMQQAYINYMQQYANMWQAGMPAAINATPAPPPMQAPQPMPPQAQAVAPQADQAQDANDDEDQPNDWLENLYALSRLAILFSLVYVYSSPFRLMLVVLLAAVYYAHSIGLFRDFGANARIAFNQPGPAEPQPNVAENNPAENQDQAINNVNNANNVPVTPPNNNEQSILAVSWMVFTTFFSSLIPELNQ